MPKPSMPSPMLRNFRVREIIRLFESRYRGLPLPDDDAGWGDLEALLTACSVGMNGNAAARLEAVAHAWAPDFDAADLAKLISKVANMPARYRPRSAATLGESLYLRWVERERLGIRTIRAFDRTLDEAAALKKEKHRLRNLQRRRSNGVSRREDYLAKFAESERKRQPWKELGISRRTFYNRKARGENPSAHAAGATCTTSVRRRKMENPTKHEPGATNGTHPSKPIGCQDRPDDAERPCPTRGLS